MRHAGNFFCKIGWFIILLPIVLGILHANDAPSNSFAQADPPSVMLPIIAGTQGETNTYEMRLLGSIPGSFNTITISGTLVFAGAQDGLSILDVSDPAQPNLRSHLPLAQGVSEIAVTDGYAYIIDGAYNLRIIDIRDIDSPELLGQYIAEDWIRSLQVVDGRAYVLQSTDSVWVRKLLMIDISNPANPSRLGELTTWSIDLYAVIGNIVYIEHRDLGSYNAFSILDMSDPTAPVVLSTTGPRASSSSAWHVDGHLFYTCWTHKYFFFDTLNISDISNPLQPIGHGFDFLPEDEHLRTLRGAGEVAYVLGTMDANTLYIYDVRKNAELLYSYALGKESIATMEVGGDRLYLLTGGRIDIYQFAIWVRGRGGKYSTRLTSTFDMTTYEFPSGAFTMTAELTHTVRLARTLPPLGERRSIGHAFETTAAYRDTGQPANPARPYSLTVQYQDAERGPVVEESLAFYTWEDGQWVREPGSTVDLDANTVAATPDHVGLWAVLGETYQIYLPLVRSNGDQALELR